MISWLKEKLKTRQKTTMAILFADVCGSTRIFETYGDEKARKIVAYTLAQLTQVVARHNGELVKTIGDEIMCKFPDTPRAYEAASEMQKRIKEHKQLSRSKMAIKVGFHWGDVLLERNDVFGDAVNVAARMVGLAKPAQIICSEATILQLPAVHARHVRSLGKVKVRGKRREMEIFEVIWQEDTSDVTMLYKVRPEQRKTSSAKLILHHHGNKIEIEEHAPGFSLGRDKQNDLSVETDLASRVHASIEYRQGKFVLTDRSTNGTYIWMENGEKFYVHREDIHLYSRGIISLGRDIVTNDPELIYYKYTSQKS